MRNAGSSPRSKRPDALQTPQVLPDEGRLVYPGDDTNDAIAVQWVSPIGGTTTSVGTKPPVSARGA